MLHWDVVPISIPKTQAIRAHRAVEVDRLRDFLSYTQQAHLIGIGRQRWVQTSHCHPEL